MVGARPWESPTGLAPTSLGPVEEYRALAPFAIDAAEIEEEAPKEALVSRAVELKIGPQSTLARWSAERLMAAIKEAEA